MTNLIDKYGADWFVHRFHSSLFLHEGEPHAVGSFFDDSGGVRCDKLVRGEEGVVSRSVTIDRDVFTDVGMFGVPMLGWRSDDKGRFLAYFSRNNRSHHRGLSPRNMQVQKSAITSYLTRRSTYREPDSPWYTSYLALKPEFTPLQEGIDKMRAGEIISFAVSPVISVMPDRNDKLAIMYKTKKAGVVDENNVVKLTIPQLSDYMEHAE